MKKFAKYFLMLSAAGTLLGIFNSSVVISTDLAAQRELMITDPIIGEFTGAYSFVFLLPVMLFVFRKYPVSKQNYILPVLIYIIAFIPVGALHILFMYESRRFIYGLIGWGQYNYGSIPYRIVMEYIKLSNGMMIALLVFILYKSFKEKEAEKVKRANLEEQLTRTKLEALKSQLNPHFLFNTLNMISSTMYEDVKAADSMIANLSTLLRGTLQSQNRKFYTLSEELEQLYLYIDIMKARFADRLRVTFSICEDALDIAVPHFLLQPIVENSIKHAMENLSVTEINISAKRSGERLTLEVTDNGPGIKDERKKVLAKGLGLSNTVERLAKTYDNDYNFEWENIEGGLVMRINIPVKVNNDN
ncbi:MAG: sensor histidine kinase [Syntrophothermus sp.]